MEKSPFIRIRIDPEIAERAYRIAAEQGRELPDILRMMVTKAVDRGSFEIEGPRASANAAADALLDPYEPRYWAEMRLALDAETALAVLHQMIAKGTTALDEGLRIRSRDRQRLERVRGERDEACALLAAFDPTNAEAVAAVLARFAPVGMQGAPEASA